MGTFGQPISYGLYHVFIIALIIYRLKNYTQYSQKHTFLKVAYLLSVINILLTVSRIPIIACILLHILLLYKKSKKEFINYAVAISILLLVLIIFNDTVAFIFSISIEVLQLFLRLGTFQLSDLFYNTVGGMIGGLMYYGITKAKKHL